MGFYGCYLPLIMALLAIIIFGFWNPTFIQTTQNNRPTGYPNYLWLALIGLIAGVITALFISDCNSDFFAYASNSARRRGSPARLAPLEM